MSLAIGDQAPDLSLPDTEGTERALYGDGQPSVVVFTCNHCPYALAWHDRILQAATDYEPRGVRFLAVNPNDAERYPADSLEAMRERVAADGGWPLPYLRDETQEAARGYGAKTTPDVFVLDADGRAPLPGRARRRPHGSVAERGVAAGGAGCPAGRRGARAAGDRPGGLQRQVEAVTAAIARSASERSASTTSAPACSSSAVP